MKFETVFRIVRSAATIACALQIAQVLGRIDTGEYAAGALSGKMIILAHLAIVALVPSAAVVSYRPRASLALALVGVVLATPALAYVAQPHLFDFLGGVSSVVMPGGPLSMAEFRPVFLSVLAVAAVALAEIAWARRPGGLSTAPA